MLPEDETSFIAELTKAIATGVDSHSFRYRMNGIDDRIHHIQNFMRIQRSERGRPYRLVGASWDITEQVEINAKLQHQIAQEHALRERLSMATQCAGIGFWEMDLVANKFLWADNPVQSIGLDEGAFGSLDLETFAQRVVPEDRTLLPDSIKRSLKDGTHRFELRYRVTPPGREMAHIHTFGSVITGVNGRPIRALGVSWDVTRNVAAAEALRRIEAAEAASAAKSSFLINMSHEIRTPMNAVIGMTTLLLDTPLNEVQREYTETIRSSGGALLGIIDDILDFSKIEAGKLELESIEMDVRALIEEVGVILAPQAAAKGIELIVDVDDALATPVCGDPTRLRQCLLNLAGNAVKFTARGQIVIKARPGEAQNGRQLIRFDVCDTGIGIGEQAIKTLFQPFVQADSSTTRQFGGTGLGLSIVRQLAEIMGGNVSVTSDLGHGSTFSLCIPLRMLELVPAPVRTNIITPQHMLVVDDNATTRQVITARLTAANHRVTVVHAGAEALLLLQQAAALGNAFDVVLYDATLVDLSGPQFALLLQQDSALRNTRLVLLAAPGNPDQCASPLPGVSSLSKPVRTRELLECAAGTSPARSPITDSSNLACIEVDTPRFAGKVLLVEDNAVNQKVARRILERLGCVVHIANDGLAGVEAFTAQPFDLVLMDLQMPVLDGISATRRIRALTTGQQVPIVALTANATDAESKRCHAVGMNAFLTKPIDVAQLRSTLAQLGLSLRDTATQAHDVNRSQPVIDASIGAAQHRSGR
jgi:signal transduction histidine kinase/DNA-binding response OmpR family regulator